jgi:hypothetical protein
MKERDIRPTNLPPDFDPEEKWKHEHLKGIFVQVCGLTRCADQVFRDSAAKAYRENWDGCVIAWKLRYRRRKFGWKTEHN